MDHDEQGTQVISLVIGRIDIKTKRLLFLFIPQKVLQLIHHYLAIVTRIVVGIGSPETRRLAILHLSGRGYLKMRVQIIHALGDGMHSRIGVTCQRATRILKLLPFHVSFAKPLRYLHAMFFGIEFAPIDIEQAMAPDSIGNKITREALRLAYLHIITHKARVLATRREQQQR